MQFVGGGLELAGRLHALVQNARDLNQPGLDDTVIDHMNRPLHAPAFCRAFWRTCRK